MLQKCIGSTHWSTPDPVFSREICKAGMQIAGMECLVSKNYLALLLVGGGQMAMFSRWFQMLIFCCWLEHLLEVFNNLQKNVWPFFLTNFAYFSQKFKLCPKSMEKDKCF